MHAASTTVARNACATCREPVEADYRSWEGKVSSTGVFVSTVEFADGAQVQARALGADPVALYV